MDREGSAYGIAIAEGGQNRMGGDPWEYRDRYIENSPALYFDRVETPVLVVHGGNDTEVAPFLADEVFVTLRRLGKQVVYAKYIGEDHSPDTWSAENQLDLGNRVVDWFNRFLGMEDTTHKE
jgi:dipeptidyl aminopeptidase/acylaminoacyl peptidase